MASIVGIDLGTTHSVVAYAEAGSDEVALLPMRQLVASGQLGNARLLASSLYLPGHGDAIPDAHLARSEAGDGWLVGAHARSRGAEQSPRVINSAKSWLSHEQVDRRAPILPWRLAGDPQEGEGDEPMARLSPVEASALILKSVASQWHRLFPEQPLSGCEVILTVPASFDAVARQLTVEAAQLAGLKVRLLEEPQAAFYELMGVAEDARFEEALGEASEGLVLVCDVGGGTTDLSLINVRRCAAGFEVERVAVGKHLLLGGDNMDLTLAHLCERKLVAQDERLPTHQFSELVSVCRDAKERLLAEDPPDDVAIAIAGKGRQLVGSTLRASLQRREVEQVVLDGFFPEVPLVEAMAAPARAGFVAFGLPYERDVAITRHLATFLRTHAAGQEVVALLLNGGVFRSSRISERLSKLVASWTDGRARWLSLTDPDVSVAQGAVRYGLALAGRGRRIQGGAAHSYYLALGGGARSAVCVLPRGAEEEHLYQVREPLMEVTVGRSVRFDLFASEQADEAGSVVALHDDTHRRLAPLVTRLDAYEHQGAQMRVALEARLSAVGTLDLSCVEATEGSGSAHHFALAFDLRAESAGGGAHEATTAAARYGRRLDEVRRAVELVYSKRTRKQVAPKDVKGLVRELERILGKRARWDASLARALFDIVFCHHRGRRTSAEHERVFWMLAGYCLRPGVGYGRDADRLSGLWALFEQRLAHAGELRSWQQFWITWRRVAAGLDEQAQLRIRDVVDPFLAPSSEGRRVQKGFRNDASWEMLELAAGLERAPAQRRGQLGGWVIERTWTERDPRLWSALGRLGARLPAYGSVHHVVAAKTIERWMDHLLRERWQEIPTAAGAALAMCCLTGDRARDISEDVRRKVADKLKKMGADEALLRPLFEVVALDRSARAELLGEELPMGLQLAGDG